MDIASPCWGAPRCRFRRRVLIANTELQGERSALVRRMTAGRRRDAGDDLDLELEAGKPIDAHCRPVRVGRCADLFRSDGQNCLDLFVRVGVEGGDVDNVIEAAPGGGQDRAQIGEGPPNLILEYRLGRAVLTAPDLTRHKEKIAGANGRGISMKSYNAWRLAG